MSEDDNLTLKTRSNYFHQLQGQLYLTGKQCCDLVVWTNKDLAIVRVPKDPEWQPNIQKLIDFYFNTFIPGIED